jgi:hypothetical protein
LKIASVLENVLLLKYFEDYFKVLADVIITFILISIKMFNIFAAVGIHVTFNV